MKCSHCGAELEKDNRCSNCGKQTNDTKKEIEVEYKEFSLSEFLEIRHKQHKDPKNVSNLSSPKEGEVLKADKIKQKKGQKTQKKISHFF